MYLNGFIQPGAGDKIAGVTCTVDGTPIIRLASLSINLSWDQLQTLQDEIIRLQCEANKSERCGAYASDVLSSLQGAG